MDKGGDQTVLSVTNLRYPWTSGKASTSRAGDPRIKPRSARPSHTTDLKFAGLARSHNQRGSENQNWKRHRAVGRPEKIRKLKWYGHATRSSGLAKTILQGTVQGERRRGRQRKRWEGSTKEWTGLEWNIVLRKAENREEWRKLVVKSIVEPQRSARLRDR